MDKIPAKTLFVGQTGEEVPECHSTNSALAEAAAQQFLPEGFMYYTQHQTAGRGQRGSTWLTPPGEALTFSVLLRPSFLPVTNQFDLLMAVSVAVREGVALGCPTSISIKWPNDLFADQKKLGGILIENQVIGSLIHQSIVGIGININQTTFPAGLAATSLQCLTGKRHDVRGVLTVVLESLEKRYLQLRQGNTDRIRQSYFENLLGYRAPLKFLANGRLFCGEIMGVDAYGRLQVLEDQHLHVFDVKEVQYPV